MIINYNCCIKLVPLVIFIYDAGSHIHHKMQFFLDLKFVQYFPTPVSIVTYGEMRNFKIQFTSFQQLLHA